MVDLLTGPRIGVTLRLFLDKDLGVAWSDVSMAMELLDAMDEARALDWLLLALNCEEGLLIDVGVWMWNDDDLVLWYRLKGVSPVDGGGDSKCEVGVPVAYEIKSFPSSEEDVLKSLLELDL